MRLPCLKQLVLSEALPVHGLQFLEVWGGEAQRSGRRGDEMKGKGEVVYQCVSVKINRLNQPTKKERN